MQARIDRHRRSDYRLRLLHRDGRPAARLGVRAELVRPAFRVGTCVNQLIQDDGPEGQRYRQLVNSTFTSLVCENAMKWYAVEAEDGRVAWPAVTAAMDFAAASGLPLRGHCLLWSKAKFVQPWVQALSPEALRARVAAHLERMAGCAGRVFCWDGINELLDGDFYGERLGPEANAAIYRDYHALDPRTPLFVNEYGILDSDAKTARYLDLIARLRAQGAPLGGIGVQEHAAERFAADPEVAAAEEGRPERQGRGPLVPEEVWQRLDRLAATGLPIHLTEVSLKTRDEERKADCLESLLTTAFAHPAVEQVLLWGFASRAHWMGREAGLLDDEWAPLPAWRRLQSWLAGLAEGHDLVTSADGSLNFRGLHGRWRLTCGPDRLEIDLAASRTNVDLHLPG